MSILSVDQISPIGSGTTVTLNATEIKTGNEITVGTGASIFSPAGNTLTLGTNNVERIRIKNDGNIGIGTITPARKLHLHQDDSSNNYLTFTNSTTGVSASNGFTIGIDASENAILNNYSASNIEIICNGSERLLIKSDGTIVTGGATVPTSSDNGNIYIKNASAIGSQGHQINYVSNAVFNGAWKYINSGTGATQFVVNQNGYQFGTAGSGTAGNNITFSNKFNISNSGAIGFSGAYGSSGQVLTSQGNSSAPTWGNAGIVLAMGYSSDASDTNTTVNNTTVYAGSTLAMTRVSATSKYILRIGAQINRGSTSSRGYLRYQVKVNSGSYNTTPGDSSRYRWYMGDETNENYREVTLTYLSSGSVGDTVTFQVGYENTASQNDTFRWQIIQATEVSALTV